MLMDFQVHNLGNLIIYKLRSYMNFTQENETEAEEGGQFMGAI